MELEKANSSGRIWLGIACLVPFFYLLALVPALVLVLAPSNSELLDPFVRPAEWLYEEFPPFATYLHWLGI